MFINSIAVRSVDEGDSEHFGVTVALAHAGIQLVIVVPGYNDGDRVVFAVE